MSEVSALEMNTYVPVKSKDFTIHTFGKTEFLVHQLSYDRRIKISFLAKYLLDVIDGKKKYYRFTKHFKS